MRRRCLQVILVGSDSSMIGSRVTLQVRRRATALVGAVAIVAILACFDQAVDVQALVHERTVRWVAGVDDLRVTV